MTRDELNSVLAEIDCIEGGTKEACIKIRSFLKSSFILDNGLYSNSPISMNEFIEGIMILIASGFQRKDEIPNRWSCEDDCRRVADLLCPGECNIKKGSKHICPYFSDEGNI